jgi:hypothetical protein
MIKVINKIQNKGHDHPKENETISTEDNSSIETNNIESNNCCPINPPKEKEIINKLPSCKIYSNSNVRKNGKKYNSSSPSYMKNIFESPSSSPSIREKNHHNVIQCGDIKINVQNSSDENVINHSNDNSKSPYKTGYSLSSESPRLGSKVDEHEQKSLLKHLKFRRENCSENESKDIIFLRHIKECIKKDMDKIIGYSKYKKLLDNIHFDYFEIKYASDFKEITGKTHYIEKDGREKIYHSFTKKYAIDKFSIELVYRNLMISCAEKTYYGEMFIKNVLISRTFVDKYDELVENHIVDKNVTARNFYEFTHFIFSQDYIHFFESSEFS